MEWSLLIYPKYLSRPFIVQIVSVQKQFKTAENQGLFVNKFITLVPTY
jgi:hypothetical protein